MKLIYTPLEKRVQQVRDDVAKALTNAPPLTRDQLELCHEALGRAAVYLELCVVKVNEKCTEE